ncbi:MAG: outer membrane lipoprotein-sorting protein [Deltaproteobacteria bacterium]|nr:outer membrane lipoprotein-sorting protein [Deltaproteobacteria bacterium]
MNKRGWLISVYRFFWPGLLLILVILPGKEVSGSEALTPKEILDRVDDLFRGRSSHGNMTMVIKTAHWQRTLSLEFWSEGKEKSLIRILAPKKEKGTATLRVDNDIWNYLPKVNRVIKLPSSMMSASWMGSHFTNDDLVKESRMAEDYTFKVTFNGKRNGRDIVEITCRPKPEAAVVWGKVVITVRKEDYLPLFSRYYDEDLNLARTMYFSDIGPLGDRILPRRMSVVPEDKPGEKTEVIYEKMSFNLVLPRDTFSIRTLMRR